MMVQGEVCYPERSAVLKKKGCRIKSRSHTVLNFDPPSGLKLQEGVYIFQWLP
jgi:hypothetical protein